MACRSAARATGSLMRLARRENQPRTELTSARSTSTMLPVSINPHVEALTNKDSLSPRCSSQAPAAILSAIRRSAVWASGMRSSASARHINMTPSGDARWYSRRKASRPEPDGRAARTASTSARPRACTAAASAAESRARSASARTMGSSGARNVELITAPTAEPRATASGTTKRTAEEGEECIVRV